MGRYRRLPDAQVNKGKAQGHALRAAINTPIQGLQFIRICNIYNISLRNHRLSCRYCYYGHDKVVEK